VFRFGGNRRPQRQAVDERVQCQPQRQAQPTEGVRGRHPHVPVIVAVMIVAVAMVVAA
jgi:hypothetical protein